MGTNVQVNQVVGKTEPVDATSMHEWEAAGASRFTAGLLFWFWYLPADVVKWSSLPRAMVRAVIRGRTLLRYPLITATPRVAARSPIRTR
jgi:hypothetical protein